MPDWNSSLPNGCGRSAAVFSTPRGSGEIVSPLNPISSRRRSVGQLSYKTSRNAYKLARLLKRKLEFDRSCTCFLAKLNE